MALGRRKFLALSLGSSAIALLGTAAVSSAAPDDPVQVWRLSANWGYAVPPKGRTRCKCSACHAHAANLVFTTSGAAVADRIHPCCVCQPFSIAISRQGYDALFSTSANIDLHDPGVRAGFETAVSDLTAVPTTTTPTPTTAPPTTTGSDTSSLVVAATVLTAAGAAIALGASPRDRPSVLLKHQDGRADT